MTAPTSFGWDTTGLLTSRSSDGATAPARLPSHRVAEVIAELRARSPLTAWRHCRALRQTLRRCAAGGGVVVQGGDCAELFLEVSEHTTIRKVAQLRELAGMVEEATGLPAIRIGRLAGQFAKPRSCPVDPCSDGVPLPVYRGDAVNSLTMTLAARTPDPRRMLIAYEKSRQVLDHLTAAGLETSTPVYASHEALLLDYEQALVRQDPDTGETYGSSAHLLWAGDRTRQPHGEHIGLLARIANPVAVKLGPSTTPRDVAALVDRLDPARDPGRLVLIARLGADRVADALPELLVAARAHGGQPLWLCDPMHANTVRTPGGRKLRAVDDIVRELTCIVREMRRCGVHPGGIHLELTPDDVTECLTLREEALPGPRLPRYWTGCDPRLNPAQARQVVAAFVGALSA